MASRPSAFVIHGGFWKPQYDASLMEPVCADLRARGWAVVNTEYRRGAGWEWMRDDLLEAWDATPCDYAVGHSAGGQLAVWLAGQRPLRGVVAQAGVLDLDRARELRLSDGIVDRVFSAADRFEAQPGAVDADVLCVHGTLDANVPLEFSTTYAERYGAALRVFEGEAHMGHIEPGNPMWACAADWLDDHAG